MELKTMLLRKGIFSRMPERDNDGDHIDVWRKVLDEMLIGMVSTNSSAKEHSLRWFNSKPGDEDYYIIDDPEDPDCGKEVKVDAFEEFSEACALAGLTPDLVREIANRTYEHITGEKTEELLNESKRK